MRSVSIIVLAAVALAGAACLMAWMCLAPPASLAAPPASLPATAAALTSQPAPVPAPVAEMGGVLHSGGKTIMPYLVLDGSEQRCYVRGRPLAPHHTGTHLLVRGVLRSKLFDDQNDYSRPEAPAPPPFAKGWVVYMEVTEARPPSPAMRAFEPPPTSRPAE